MTQIIAINGFKRSGKGTVARMLFDNHPGVVYEIGFADKLKMFGALALGFQQRTPREQIALMDEFKLSAEIAMRYHEPGEADGRVHELTGREFLQNLGNEARGLFGDSFWIDMVLPQPAVEFDMIERRYYVSQAQNEANLSARYPDVDVVAITDLRYTNEAERVKALGGVVWEVVRPGVESDGHASEQPLPPELVDRVIVNDGSLDNLAEKVNAAMEAVA